MSDTRNHYYNLTIDASSASTAIWLSDEYGHFVQKATGRMETSLLAADYFVEFELGGSVYPICLKTDMKLTECEITQSPPCARPEVKLFDGDWSEYYGEKPDPS